MDKKKVVCASCIAFGVALLVSVPIVFVWNLFLNGQGSFDWAASLTLSLSVAAAYLGGALVKRGLSKQPRGADTL